MFLLSQKNSLHKAVEEQGLKRRDFKLTDSEKNTLRIVHQSTGYHFRIGVQEVISSRSTKPEPRLFTRSTPKRGKLTLANNEETGHEGMDDWQTVIHVFSQWLVWLRSETTQPDLWAQMEEEPYMFADEEPITDERFTSAEIKLLEERVAEVEQRVLALGLPSEAEAAVVETVREVPAKAKRFTKKELADCIVGSLVKEGFKWGLTTEHMSAAWHGIQFFFATYIGPHI